MPSLLARTRASDESLLAQRTEPREHGLSETNRVGSVPYRGPSSEESLALRLSDTQLDGLMSRMRGAGASWRERTTNPQ
jgi:hypothetical protein